MNTLLLHSIFQENCQRNRVVNFLGTFRNLSEKFLILSNGVKSDILLSSVSYLITHTVFHRFINVKNYLDTKNVYDKII